jgi:ribosome biogenesis protein BMS1
VCPAETEQPHDQLKDSLAAGTSALEGGPGAAAAAFTPSAAFAGARPGFVFQRGAEGVGYYRDEGPEAAGRTSTKAAAAISELPPAVGDPPLQAANGGDGWVGMRTVAQLRRELGVGAPRNSDSLYRFAAPALRRDCGVSCTAQQLHHLRPGW